jgi:hypothetical protein
MAKSLAPSLEAALTRTLSDERIDYWKRVAGGNLTRGLLLHQRNAFMAGALFADLQVIEVALRNAFDRELITEFPPDWLDDGRFSSRKPVMDAKDYASRDWRRAQMTGSPTRDKIIVQLSFGFWVALFRDPTLQPALVRAFKSSNIAPRKVSGTLGRLLRLRNELAHHEPIIIRDGVRHRENLPDLLRELNELLLAICPVTAEWARRHSFVRPLVEAGLFSCDEPGEHEVPFFVP